MTKVETVSVAVPTMLVQEGGLAMKNPYDQASDGCVVIVVVSTLVCTESRRSTSPFGDSPVDQICQLPEFTFWAHQAPRPPQHVAGFASDA